MMQKILILALILFIVPTIVCAQEYRHNENITISLTNATDGKVLKGETCYLSLYNSSYGEVNITMTDAGDGTYFWLLNNSIAQNLSYKYKARIICTAGGKDWSAWSSFYVVEDTISNKTQYIKDNPSDYQATGFSTHDPIDVWEYSNRNLTYTNTTDELTPSDVWDYATRSLTQNITQNLTAKDVWTYSTRDLTDYNQTDLSVNLTQNAFDTIANMVWGASSRTLTSFGTLIADIWAYTTRTLTNWNEIYQMVWNDTATERNLTTGQWGTTDFLNATQEYQLENASAANVTGAGVTNVYDNSTMNIILPTEAI